LSEKQENKIYKLAELKTKLEQIRLDGEGDLSYPSAIYCLVKEIESLTDLFKLTIDVRLLKK